MIVSIHQPNFLPWMGFFDKLNKSDHFVFLTTSMRSKSDKYLTRTTILNDSASRYLSIPLGTTQVPINQLLMPVNDHWKTKALNIIYDSYHSCNYYEDVISNIEELLMNESKYFSDYSINIINYLIRKLNIDTLVHVDTDFNKDFGSSNERNIAICKEMNAEIYFSGAGASTYNDLSLYKNNNITLVYQNYLQPKYSQKSSKIISGLSILDVIFNCGYEETERMIKNNERSK